MTTSSTPPAAQTTAGRRRLINGNSQLLYRGMKRLAENCLLNIKNKSHSVSAQLQVPDGGADGVIISQGGAFVGWSLYLKAGKPTYHYNFAGLQRFTIDRAYCDLATKARFTTRALVDLHAPSVG